jgi:hypothetical protein
MAVVQCPSCTFKADVPEEVVGKWLRCKHCQTKFQANPGKAAIKEAGPRRSATATMTADGPRAKTAPVPVVVRERAGAGKGGVGWVVAAIPAFLLPVAAAGLFIGIKGCAPPPPTSDLYAGIEVSSSAVSCAVFEVEKRTGKGVGSPHYSVVFSNSVPIDLRKQMAQDGKLDPKGVQKVAWAVRTCYEQLSGKESIPADRIYLVGSGGLEGPVRMNPRMRDDLKKERISQNRRELRRALEKEVSKEVDFIDPEEEAEYQLNAIVEADHRDDGVFVDVGNGATRGYYREDGRVRKIQLAGVSDFAKRKKETGRDYPILAKNLLRQPFQQQAQNARGFVSRKHVYLAGGIVWAMAVCRKTKQYTEPPEAGLYIDVKGRDIENFAEDVRQSKGKYLETFRPPVLPDDQKEKANQELAKIRKFFPPEKLWAGAEMLAALSEEMGLPSKTTVRFHRQNANVVWMADYIFKHARLK